MFPPPFPPSSYAGNGGVEMDWFRIAVIILVIIKTVEFSYRLYKWIKNKKNKNS